MVDLNSILKSLPIDDVAKQLGVSPEVAEQAVKEASSVLVAGLAKNASTPEGAESLQSALQKHAEFSGVNSVADVDTADGQKILNHILGGKTNDVAQALSEEPATAGIDFSKLLPALAPILMGVLGSSQKSSGGGIGDLLGGLLGGGNSNGGGGIGDILGGLLGGGGGQQQASAGGGLGDILGGLLGGGNGGGQQASAGGGLGDILGGLLGGGSADGKNSGPDLGGILGGLLGGNK